MISLSDSLVIINPNSNEGTATKIYNKASKQFGLPQNPIDITAISIDQLLIKSKPKLIIIAGGDGTINAVCNSVYRLKIKPTLAIIPLGFGNALAYCLGVESIEKAVDVLRKPDNKTTIDLIKTNIPSHKIGVFNLSVGFDARIVFNRQHYRYIGYRSYILSAIRSFVFHTEQEITFRIDNKVTLNARASSLVIANCPVIGQNYIISPNAKLNDGLLDCTLFSTKYDYLTNLRFQGFKHPLYSELGKVRFKASSIRIEGEPYVQIDGDPVVYKEGIEIASAPASVTFLRNSLNLINQQYLPF